MALSDALLKVYERWAGAEQPESSYGDGSGGRVVHVLEVQLRDIVNDSSETIYVSDYGYLPKTGDAVQKPMPARLRLSTISASLLSGSEVGHGAPVISGAVSISNLDGFYDEWIDESAYSWIGRLVTLKAGSYDWSYDDFETIKKFRIEGFGYNDEEVKLTLKPALELLRRPVQQVLYSGRGGAYDFAGTATVDVGNVYNLGLRDNTVEVWFKTSGSGSNEILLDKRNSLAASGVAGWVVYKGTGDDLRIRIDDGTNTVLGVIGSAGEYTDGAWHILQVTIDRTNDEMTGYVDGVEELAATDISSVTGRISNTAAFTHGSLASGTNKWNGEIDEPRIWRKVLTAGQIANRSQLSVDGVEAGLVGAWRYDEYGGTDIFNEVVGPGLVRAHFNGSRNCSMGTSAMDAASKSFTLTGWFNCASGASGVLAGRRTANPAANVGYSVRIVSGDIVVQAADGSTLYAVTVSGPFDDSTLYGFALVVDRTDNELRGYVLDYARGTLTPGTPADITGAGSFGGGSVNFKLGEFDGGTVSYTGYLSWIFYTEAALDPVDIRIALAEQAVDLDDDAATTPPSLTAYAEASGSHFYPLDENTGATATDQIGAADGTFSSTPTWVDRDGDLASGIGSDWTSTLEGNAELKGLPKPMAVGRPRRINPISVDWFFDIWQFSTPSIGASHALESAFGGALLLTEGSGDDYTKDLTNSTVTMVSSLTNPLTLNVRGLSDGAGYFHFRTGQVLRAVFEDILGLTTADYNTTSFDDYDVSFPYEIGLYLDNRPHLLEEVLEAILMPRGYWKEEVGGGKFAIGLIVDPGGETAEVSIHENVFESLERLPGTLPIWRRRLAYDRTFGPHESFVGAATTQNKNLHAQEFRFLWDRDDDAHVDHAGAAESEDYSLVIRRRDAKIELDTLFARDAQARAVWVATLGRHAFRFDVGTIVGISRLDERLNLATEKNFQVVGYEYTFGTDVGFPITNLELVA